MPSNSNRRIAAIIPALNEAGAIGGVVRSARHYVDRVIVVDNGSTDGTADVAIAAGACVTFEPVAGYGRACMTGVAAAGDSDIYLFLDGDGADILSDIPHLLHPILSGQADLAIASRTRGVAEAGALTTPQRFGNWLACRLMRLFWQSDFTDLGPFRAITREAYESLPMTAPTYGWTVQMQVRALKQGIKTAEIPTGYHRRIGRSKISGTVKGVILAGSYILGTILRERFEGNPARPIAGGPGSSG